MIETCMPTRGATANSIARNLFEGLPQRVGEGRSILQLVAAEEQLRHPEAVYELPMRPRLMHVISQRDHLVHSAADTLPIHCLLYESNYA